MEPEPEPEPAKKVPAPAPEGNGLGWGANLIMLFHIRGVNRYISCRPLRIRYAPTRSQLADTGSTSPNNVKVGVGSGSGAGF